MPDIFTSSRKQNHQNLELMMPVSIRETFWGLPDARNNNNDDDDDNNSHYNNWLANELRNKIRAAFRKNG